jgi:actin-related protein 2
MISGGTSLFPGFSTRLDKDIRRLWIENNDVDHLNVKINIKDPPRRKFSVFMGSCVYV